jgi:hypothetical protein
VLAGIRLFVLAFLVWVLAVFATLTLFARLAAPPTTVHPIM